MIKCYTYYLIHIPTGKKYYGVRWANIALNLTPEEDFWGNGYCSSSIPVQLLLEKDGKESFKAEIRKLFDTKEEARAWEHKVLRRMKAVQREDWLNEANYSEEFYRDNSGEKNPMYGRTGEKHPMYGKSNHSIWVEKYGQEEADRKKEAAKKLMSIAHIGLKTGEKNPMYGKSAHSIWVEKYGQEEADRKKEAAKKLMSIAHIGLQTGEKGSSYIKRIKNNPYPKVCSPDGEIHKISGTLKDFAKEHNLDSRHLSKVINGKLKSHKGWKLAK